MNPYLHIIDKLNSEHVMGMWAQMFVSYQGYKVGVLKIHVMNQDIGA
jgi:hypothetical protein